MSDFEYVSVRSNTTYTFCLLSNIDCSQSALYCRFFMFLQTVAYRHFKSRDFISIFKTVMKILNSSFTVLVPAELHWKHFHSLMSLH